MDEMTHKGIEAYHLPPDTIFIEEVEDGSRWDSEVEARIEAIWREELARRPGGLFNGDLFSLTVSSVGEGLSEKRLRGRFVEYRHFVAQLRDPGLFPALRVRPLAVTGLTVCRDGLILGLRARNVMQDGGLWELVPAGGISTQARDEHRRINPEAQILDELFEETNITGGSVVAIRPKMLIIDNASHVHDVVMEVEVDLNMAEVNRIFLERENREYVDIRAIPIDGIDEMLDHFGFDITVTSKAILAACGLIGFDRINGAAREGQPLPHSPVYLGAPEGWPPVGDLEDLWEEIAAGLRFIDTIDDEIVRGV